MSAKSTVTRLRRSISMPADDSIEIALKPLARSKEKETIYDDVTNDEGSAVSQYDIETKTSKQLLEYIDSLKIKKRSQINRVIKKNGVKNVRRKHMPERIRYFKDFVTSMVALNWTYMSLIFMGTYFVTWFIFGALCYWVAVENGDFIIDEITGEKPKDICFTDINNFVSMFLYSIGTQTTIGFNQNPSEDCPGAMVLLMIQMIVSIFIEGALLSIIYVKAASPAKQINKLRFSDKAVISYRDDALCLLFRVCDPREQQTIESKIRVFLIEDKITQEGESLKTQTELKLMNDGRQLIAWPDIVCHIIDATSPLGHIKSAKDLNAAQFELYVSIAGCSPSTAQFTEACTSYVPQEIIWGQRFVNIIDYDEQSERYVIDFSNFNTTISFWDF